MSLRQRTILIIGTTLFTLTALLYLNVREIMLHSFSNLEEQYLLRDINQVKNSIDVLVENLNTLDQDWASWDDTYGFMQNRNQDFIDVNLVDQTFAGLELNFMLFVDTSGKLVYGRAYDLENDTFVPVSDELLTTLIGSGLIQQNNNESSISGIVILPENPALVSSQPVLTSMDEGPIRGSLIMGRYINDEVINKLSNTTDFNISLYPLARFQTLHSAQTVNSILADDLKAIEIASDDAIFGYGVVQDVSGSPSLIFRVSASRDIYNQGKQTLNLFLISLGGLGLAFTLVVLMLLERMVLMRLKTLSDTVDHVQASGDLSTQVPVQGDDELAGLARNVQNLLLNLDDYQTQLHQVNEHLEEQVFQRTRELADTVDRLEQEIEAKEEIRLKLADAHSQALNAIKVKSQILANISHDARTPLSVIVLRIEMLKRGHYGHLTEKQNQVLDGMLASAYEMLGFIDNMLQGSKLETTEQLKPSKSMISPERWLAGFLQTVQPLADQKGLALMTNIAADLPHKLYTDPEWLKHIVSNLANNAIKFTQQGSVSIDLFRDDPQHWSVCVKDTGPGIPEDAHERIFEAFWQVDGSATRTVSRGVGLGLSIVQQLARGLGGTVTVDSTPGIGSSFSVHFPIETTPDNLT